MIQQYRRSGKMDLPLRPHPLARGTARARFGEGSRRARRSADRMKGLVEVQAEHSARPPPAECSFPRD